MYQKKQQKTLLSIDLDSNQSFFNTKLVLIKGLVNLKKKRNFLSQSLFLTSTWSNTKLSCFKSNAGRQNLDVVCKVGFCSSWQKLNKNSLFDFSVTRFSKRKTKKLIIGYPLDWKSYYLNGKKSFSTSDQNLANLSTQTLDIGIKGQKIIEYSLDSYNRSNQDTCLLHRPAVFEGQWVQSGDLLADCASSVGGELALGQNLLIAYMPWEGYNYEDAILISERLVYDDLYTSVHIEKYELETRETKLGNEEITREIPDILESEIDHLDQYGIVKVGSWVEEGDILVGKTTPINKKSQSPYQKLLSTILEKDLLTVRDSSLRAPKGIRAKIVKVQLFQKKKKRNLSNFDKSLNERSKNLLLNNSWSTNSGTGFKVVGKKLNSNSNIAKAGIAKSERKLLKEDNRGKNQNNFHLKSSKFSFFSLIFLNNNNNNNSTKLTKMKKKTTKRTKSLNHNKLISTWNRKKNYKISPFLPREISSLRENKLLGLSSYSSLNKNKNKNSLNHQNLKKRILLDKKPVINYLVRSKQKMSQLAQNQNLVNSQQVLTQSDFAQAGKIFMFGQKAKHKILRKEERSTPFFSSGLQIHLYLAEKRKVQVGDKLAGRHGNKGIISQILPREDMPYLPDGTPIDMVLNPLGVPSRMNVGQIYECLLGLAGKFLGENYKVFPFDEIYGPEASRSFVFSKLNEARKKTGLNWLFDANTPGKIRLYDGRTGDCFDQAITVGQAYILRLVHMVDDKIHCLTPEHEVLTTEGWVPIPNINHFHKIATLQKNGNLEYKNPLKIFNYSDFKGTLYHIKNANLDLLVTLNHRMYVKNDKINSNNRNSNQETSKSLFDQNFKGYELIEAQKIIGKNQCYLKNANWVKLDYQFILPSHLTNSQLSLSKKPDMKSWLVFFGIWITKGCNIKTQNYKKNFDTKVEQNKQVVHNKNFTNLRFTPFQRGVGDLERDMEHDQSNLGQRVSVLENTNISEGINISTNVQKNKKTYYSVEISLGSLKLKNPVIKLLGVDKEPFLSFSKLESIHDILFKALDKLSYSYHFDSSLNKVIINNKQLWNYLRTLRKNQSQIFLPSWVWNLSKKQARLLLETMMFANGIKRNHSSLKSNTFNKNDNDFYTLSNQLADDLMRLALHSGWSANKLLLTKAKGLNLNPNNVISSFSSSFYPRKEKLTSQKNLWCVSIIQTKNNPSVNSIETIEQKVQREELLTYEGPVFCLSVPNEIFYVRRNGLPIWTGNSRSIGPYSLVTQQPLRGRSKQGGQRLGEMEVWALEGYGAAFTLLEMLTLKSDDMTGRMTLWSNLILNGEIAIGTPESFKVLICELQALCLDIGLFRVNQIDLKPSSNTISNSSSLVAVENLMNFK